MKKLAIIIAAGSLALATPVFACPHDESAPKTAEKKKEEAPAKAKEAPKKEEPTTAKKKEENKDTAKKPDKVSQK